MQKKYLLESATESDDREILEILEENVFPGPVSLVYTRRPNAYRSFMQEGEQGEVVVCRDKESGTMAGMGAYSIYNCLIDDKPEKVAYIHGLRLRKEFIRSIKVLPLAYRELLGRISAAGASVMITTILEDNSAARKLLTKKRKDFPAYNFLDTYNVFGFKKIKRPRLALPGHIKFRKAQVEDKDKISAFLSGQAKQSQLFPDNIEMLIKQNALAWDSFYLLLDTKNAEILACGAAWDQANFKQYVLKGFKGLFKPLGPLVSLLNIISRQKFLTADSALRFFILSFWHIKDNKEEYLRWFLDQVLAWQDEHPLFVLGIPDSHPLRKCFSQKNKLTYKSNMYLVNNEKRAAQLRRKPLYFECGWL